MGSWYKFNQEEIEKIGTARRLNKNKRVENRLKALSLRAEGKSLQEISDVTGYNPAYVTALVRKYRKGGLEALTENHYPGNRRNLTYEQEAEILAPFKERAERGEMVAISEIETAYQNAVDHPIGNSQIYFVLHRHGWRKVMPRSKHPQKASDEVIEASKKLKIQ